MENGEKRSPGRPRTGAARKIQFTITLSPDRLAFIDEHVNKMREARHNYTRSEYIDTALELMKKKLDEDERDGPEKKQRNREK